MNKSVKPAGTYAHTGSFCLALIFSTILYSSAISATIENKSRMVLEGMPTPEEQAMINTLKNDINILDTEIAKCEKKKKGWIAATVIGSTGVVSTGIAAAVQGAKISEQKKDLANKQHELDDIKEQTKSLQ